MRHDLRLAVRGLLKSPIYTFVTVATLALGLGATTAIFSVVHGVLLNPLPVEAPDRVLYIRESRLPQFPSFSVAPGHFVAWRRDTTSFASMAAVATSAVVVTGLGEPERIRADRATADLFPLLGVTPIAGRVFTADEDRPGGEPVVVLGEGYWRRRFGGDATAVGRTIALNGRLHTIVGVVPASLTPILGEVNAWTPIAFSAQDEALHGSHFLRAYGRLKPGVELRTAQADLDRVAVQLEAAFPDSSTGWRTLSDPLPEFLVRNVRTALIALSAAVLLVLLVVCANVASLSLARGLSRQRELAVRVALGAERGRIVREMLTEGFVLAATAGLCGLAIAWAILRTLVAFGPTTIPRLAEVGLNPTVLLFAAVLALAAPAFFSLLPAIQSSRGSLRDALTAGGRTVRTTLRARTRAALVVGQISVALVLLIGCTLLVRSFMRLVDVDPGFNPQQAFAAGLQLPAEKYPTPADRVRFQALLMDRVAALPGVVAVGLSQSLPLVSDMVASLEFEGRAPVAASDRPSANIYSVSGKFFDAMGIRLIRGRTIDDRDRADAPRVVVVSETFARRFYPGEDPIGRRILITQGPNDLREIIGIVADTKQYGLAADTPAQVYESFQQQPFSSVSLVVRTAGDPATISAGVRASVSALDPDQPLGRVQLLQDVVDTSLGSQRFSLALFTAFAAVALLLASLGLYGLVAYTVSQRTPEIGLRLALGARPADVMRLIVRQALSLGLVGIACGLAAAFGASRLMTSLLFETSPSDTVTYVAVPAVLLAVIVAASVVPARRASLVDPAVTLRP
jgi:putative ABC transport system permease protein